MRRKKKWIETKRGKINKVNAIQPQMDVQDTLFQSTVSFDNNSVNEKLQVFIFVLSRLFLHGNFCWDFTFIFWSWKSVKLLMTYQNRRSKMSLKLVVSCFSSRKLESQYSWHFAKDQVSFIHIISCYPQTFSESKYLRLSVATYFALIYNFHVTFFIRKLQTLQNIKVQVCRFCILPVLS